MNAEIHTLSGAYAVDALSEDERVLFEAHLATCAACREEVDSLRETAGLLGESVAVPPPPSLRKAVLAGIGEIRPLPPLVEAGNDNVVPLRRRRFATLVAAAAAVVALGAGAALWHPWTDATTQVSVADQVLNAPDATRAQASVGTAHLTLVRSASLGKAVILADALPAPAGDRVYEMWLQNAAGDMVPAGLLPRSPSQKFVLSGDAASAQAAGITVEPAGGSDRPTSAPIALFAFEDA